MCMHERSRAQPWQLIACYTHHIMACIVQLRPFASLSVSLPREAIMLTAAIWLFVLAILAALLGFGGIAGAAAGLAKIAFVVFLVLAVIGFIMGRSPTHA